MRQNILKSFKSLSLSTAKVSKVESVAFEGAQSGLSFNLIVHDDKGAHTLLGSGTEQDILEAQKEINTYVPSGRF